MAPTVKPPASAKGSSSKDKNALARHLTEGRRLSKRKDFQGAIAELDRALAIAPKDGEVLAELGWAAFQAKDYERAKTANRQALTNTSDPKLRAQILYNTGRVAEEQKDKESARVAYGESLSLRDNAEVEKRFIAVGGDVQEITRPWSTCDKGFATLDALCKCLVEAAPTFLTATDETTKCSLNAKPPKLGDPRLSIVHVESGPALTKASVLVATDDDKLLRAIALLGEEYSPGAFGVHNTVEILGVELKKLKTRTLAIVKHAQKNTDLNMAGLQACHDDSTFHTFCLVGDAKHVTKCAGTIPVHVVSECGPGVVPDPKELDPETTAMMKEIVATASKSEVKVDYEIDPTGKLVSKVKSGDETLLPKNAVRELHLLAPKR